MESRLAFIGGDERMTYAREVVAAGGYTVTNRVSSDLTHIVLPLPAFDRPGHITGGPALNEILPYIPGKIVLGGRLGVQEQYLLSRAEQVIDLLDDEFLTAGNAEITAEGAIELLLQKLPVTLSGTSVLVIGWGRIGQLLCRKLQALGARVTASARKARDQGLISAMGLRPDKTGLYEHGLSGYRAILNTVPAMVISPEQALSISPSCVYLELASVPGVDPSLISETRFLPAGGLPGKTAPESAGILIGQTILRLLRHPSPK